MAKSLEPTPLMPEEIERAVEIFTTHLSDACKQCAEEDLNDMALISAVFAGLVEITHRTMGENAMTVLRQMIEDLDVAGSPLHDAESNSVASSDAEIN